MMKRIFIAVPVKAENEFLTAYNDIRTRLNDEGIKWVEAFNLHLTLKFLGETEEERIERIKEVLLKTVENYSQFEFAVTGLGSFGPRKKPTVVYAGIEGQEILKNMALRIDSMLSEIGFEPESRPYKAHLTLGRIKFLNNPEKLNKVIRIYENKFFQKAWAEKLILFESILKREGPTYRPLLILPL